MVGLHWYWTVCRLTVFVRVLFEKDSQDWNCRITEVVKGAATYCSQFDHYLVLHFSQPMATFIALNNFIFNPVNQSRTKQFSCPCCNPTESRGSSVSIVTRLRAGRPGFSSPKGQWRYLFFATASGPALGPTQPRFQWTGGYFPGNKAVRARADVKNGWNYSSTPPYLFMTWCLVL